MSPDDALPPASGLRPLGAEAGVGGAGERPEVAAGRRRRSGLRPARLDQVPGHPEDPPSDADTVARVICLRLLTGQPRTRAELATALARRGVPSEAAGRVLGRFAEVGLIDDKAFADAWVDSRHAGRGLGRRTLSAELRRRGVDDRTVTDAVAGLDPDTELETARRLVRRRLPSTVRLEPPARFRRLLSMLARKGYPAATALRAVREELDVAGDEDGGLLAAEEVAGTLDADENG
jgi:regulatory protein